MNIRTELTQFAENQVEIKYLDGKLIISAPEGAICEQEKQRLKQHKSDIEEYFRQMGIQSNFYFAELSFAQQRLWLAEQIEEQKGQYNISQIVKIKGRVDLEALEFAIKQTIIRHDILRSIYKIDADGTVLQLRTHLPEQVLFVEQVNNGFQGLEAVYRKAQQFARKPFDLSWEIPIRVALYSSDADNHLMVFCMHHIASDGSSNGILLKDINQYYNRYLRGNSQSLPPLAIQYMDYARWQRGYLTDQNMANQVQYWQQKLKGVPQVHELPTDRSRPRFPSHRGRVYASQIPAQVLDKLKQVASQNQASLFMLLSGVFALLKGRLSGQEDIVFGTPFANRERTELQQMVGLFVNTLVLRYQLEASFSFNDLIALSKTTLLEAYEHQDIPFDALVESLKPERNMSVTPFFQTLFSFHSHKSTSLDFAELEISSVQQQEVAAQFDLVLDAVEENHQLTLSWVYAEDLFDEASMAAMHNAFSALCAGLAADPKANIFSLPLVSEAEQARLFCGSKGGAGETAVLPENICDKFLQLAQNQPNNTALQFDNGTLTYQQLRETVVRLATLIRKYDLLPESRVGIYMGRSHHVVTSVLAVMMSGNAFVPLDPDYPESRIAHIIADAQIEVVLTLEQLQMEVLDHCDNVLALDSELISKILTGLTPAQEKLHVAPDSLAYILYTSGTSGLPRGVAVEHQQLSNYVEFALNEYINCHGIEGSVLSSSLSFDATITAMLPSLMVGVPLVIIEQEAALFDELLALLNSTTPYLFKLTPAHLFALANLISPECIVQTKHLLVVGGEQLEYKVCQAIKKHFEQVIIVNEYGPTETVVGCCLKYVDDTVDDKVPIGNPIAGSTLLLMSEYQQIQPKGAVGEIYIAGPSVSRGYHDNPALTEQKFVWLDLGNGHRQRFYRTGDLAKRMANDELMFLGRNDHQIKVRGFRIEPEEISRVAISHDHVDACQVLIDEAQQRLVAYLLPHLTEEQLYRVREHFKRSLPDYMQPDLLIPVQEFPYTINGKLDTQKLASMDVSQVINTDLAEPETLLQEQLCELWCELLHLPQVSIDDSFFEIGGHSLLATQLVAQLRQQHDLFIEVRDIFKHNTIRELSLLLEQELNIHSLSATEMTEEDEVWEI